jgi:short-subunit dehydrogenase
VAGFSESEVTTVTMLSGKNVLLTGGSRGMGPHIAEALARRGANLALVARSQNDLDQAAARLRTFGARVAAVAADLASETGRRHAVRTAADALGQIDILVNNAGLETEGAFLRVPWEELRATVEVNLLAPLELAHLVLPGMVERGSGVVVNLSSLGGKAGTPYDAVYCATKAALAHWAKGVRLELAGTGVRIATIYPGYVTETGMFARFGVKAPWLVGSCTPAQVVGAVLRAIERECNEQIVNSQPMRPMLALAELFPGLVDPLMRRMGVVDFQRRKVGNRA